MIRKSKEVIKEYLNTRKTLYKKVELHFAYQKAPLGLGDAIKSAKKFIEGAPFVMAIPDQILLSKGRRQGSCWMRVRIPEGYGVPWWKSQRMR